MQGALPVRHGPHQGEPAAPAGVQRPRPDHVGQIRVARKAHRGDRGRVPSLLLARVSKERRPYRPLDS